MIYLHVGLGKCGSSTIQHFATAHMAALREAGLVYPALQGRAPEQHMAIGPAARLAFSNDAHDLSPRISALREDIAKNPNASYLLSSEFFLKHEPQSSARNAQALRSFLGTAPVRVLVYIREYPAWVESLYAQKTKRGENADDMDDFILKRGMVNKVSMVAGLKPWVEVFGAENIRLRSLSRANLVGGDLITDLLDAVEVSISMPPFERANESPHWTFLELARNITARIPDAESATKDMFRVWLKRLAQRTERVLAVSGLKPARIQYLARRDWVALRDVYNHDVTQINAMLPDHAVPLMDTPMISERGPPPSMRDVPPPIRAAYLDAIAAGRLMRAMPPPFRLALRPLLKSRRQQIRRAEALETEVSELHARQPEDKEQKTEAGEASAPVRQG